MPVDVESGAMEVGGNDALSVEVSTELRNQYRPRYDSGDTVSA